MYNAKDPNIHYYPIIVVIIGGLRKLTQTSNEKGPLLYPPLPPAQKKENSLGANFPVFITYPASVRILILPHCIPQVKIQFIKRLQQVSKPVWTIFY